MNKDQQSEALKVLDEIKERFGESPKIVNLKISCFMLQSKFEEALSIAVQLQ